MLRFLPCLATLLGVSALSNLSFTSVQASSTSVKHGRRADVPIPDPASRVNLFIGTIGFGHVFPGAFQLSWCPFSILNL